MSAAAGAEALFRLGGELMGEDILPIESVPLENGAAALFVVRGHLAGRFTAWMAAIGNVFPEGSLARDVLLANLDDELDDQHGPWLEKQVGQLAGWLSNPQVVRKVREGERRLAEEYYPRVDRLLREGTPMQQLAFMTFLERFSDAAVAFIAAMTHACGGSATPWSDRHGPADAPHANAMWAAFLDVFIQSGENLPEDPCAFEPFVLARDLWRLSLVRTCQSE